MQDQLADLDKQLLIYLNGLGSEQWDGVWITITHFYYWTPLFLLWFYLFIKYYGIRTAARLVGFCLLLILAGLLFSEGIKLLTERARPVNDSTLGKIVRHIIIGRGYSFFSGHATTSFGLAIFIYNLLRRKTLWVLSVFLWAALFTYSRIYLAMHFPSDIIAGIAMGSLLGWLFSSFCKKELGEIKEEFIPPRY